MVLNSLKLRVGRLLIMLFVFSFAGICYGSVISDDTEDVDLDGFWDTGKPAKNLESSFIIVSQNSYQLAIQDSNPVNTITVKITSNETGATVFENVYPQGQTSFIVIPINGWSAGSYTIELFGRENNGYLWGTFQVLP